MATKLSGQIRYGIVTQSDGSTTVLLRPSLAGESGMIQTAAGMMFSVTHAGGQFVLVADRFHSYEEVLHLPPSDEAEARTESSGY